MTTLSTPAPPWQTFFDRVQSSSTAVSRFLRFYVVLLIAAAFAAGASAQSVSSISLSPSSVVGGSKVAGTLTLTSPAPKGGLTFALSSDSAAATPDASVKFSKGDTSAGFLVKTSAVATDAVANISAGNSSFALTITAPTAQSVTVSPATVNGGASATGVVSISSAAPASGLTISLASDNGVAAPDSSVVIAGGKTTGRFNIATFATADATAHITATLNASTASTTLNVLDPQLSVFTITHNPVIGGKTAHGHITLNEAPARGGVDVSLSSSNPALASVPATVHVCDTDFRVRFPITTTQVTDAALVTITATINGSSSSTVLQVTSSQLISLTVDQASFIGPGTANATLKLRDPIPTNGLAVQLSSDSSWATVPSTVTFYRHMDHLATFPITLTNPPTHLGVATITASLNGDSIFITIAVTSTAPSGPQWGQFGFDSRHSGVGLGSGAAGVVSSQFTITETGVPLVLAADGTMFLASNSYAYPNINAYNPDGTFKLSYGMDYPATCIMLGADGSVFAQSASGSLYAFNSDGTVRWTAQAGGYGGVDVMGPDGTLYASDRSGSTVMAINPSDGSIRWSAPVGYLIPKLSVAADGTVYVITQTFDYDTYEVVYALVAISSTGAVQWTTTLADSSYQPPAIALDGTVIVCEPNTVQAINPDGTTKWSFATASFTTAVAVSPNGIVYVSDYTATYTIDPEGNLISKFDFSSLNGSIDANNGYTIAIGSDGTAYVAASVTTDDANWSTNIYAISPDGSTLSLLTALEDDPNAVVDLGPIIGNDGTLYIQVQGLIYTIK